MAITGLPVIAPALGAAGVLHHMSNLDVTALTGQDGVWSCPDSGSTIDNVRVSGGSGVTKYGLRVGATISAAQGKYSNIVVTDAIGDGIWLTQANECQFSNVGVHVPGGHGVNIDSASDRNQFVNLVLSNPSSGTVGVSDGIHVTDGDSNMFNMVSFDPTFAIEHKTAVDFSGGVDNRLGMADIVPGTVNTFLETTPGDNDFGLMHQEWDYAGVVALATGGIRFPILSTAEIMYVEVWVGTAPTGSTIIVDVNKNGASIFPVVTNPTIAIAGFSNLVIPDTKTLAVGDYLTVDIDQADSNSVGADLSVVVRYRTV